MTQEKQITPTQYVVAESSIVTASASGVVNLGSKVLARIGPDHDQAEVQAMLHRANTQPELLESLKHAVAIIRKYVPEDALGTNSQGGGDGFNDQSWPLLDEYLHHMDAAITNATASPMRTA